MPTAPLEALPWDPRLAPLRDDLLERYLAFIGQTAQAPSLGAVGELQRAHLLAIPFETLSPMTDEPVPLDEDSLASKLLCGHRGGYCFEHNLLFAGALVALGYDAEILAGRVLVDATAPRPRSHAAVRVRLDGRDYLTDVGFGRTAFRGPVDLSTREPQEIEGYAFRIGEIDGEIRVDIGDGAGEWEAQYLLDPRPVQRIDCEQLNVWVSTDDRSIVRQQVIALRPLPRGRRAIRGGRLMIDEPGRHVDRELTAAELPAVLREEFGIELPAGRTPPLVR